MSNKVNIEEEQHNCADWFELDGGTHYKFIENAYYLLEDKTFEFGIRFYGKCTKCGQKGYEYFEYNHRMLTKIKK